MKYMCIDLFSMLKCNPSMCCRWAWQTPVWLWGVPKLAPRLGSTWAIYSAAQSSQNCCFNSDKGILTLSRSIYPPKRSFSSPTHHKHVTLEESFVMVIVSLVVLTRPGLRLIPVYSGESRNPHVSTYTSSPKSKFPADQFLYKIKLQEFRAQLKIAE